MTVHERTTHLGDPLHGLAEAGLEELIDSTAALRRQLDAHDVMCRQVLDDLRDHVPMGCALPAARADAGRSALTDAIKQFEAIRHRSRLALVAISLEEGSTIAEIARTWGVSRQLASRWVAELAPARTDPDGVEPATRRR